MVVPAKGLNPSVDQVYPIVNSVFKQMTGRTDLEAVDTNSLIAMGTELDNMGKKELWLNTLYRLVGLTIDGYRVYRNKMSSLARNNMEWGAIVRKITAEMPEAVADEAWDVGQMDGQSIDQWIISNPKVHQRVFDKQVPYAFRMTIQEYLLNDAFHGASEMGAFINQIFGKVQNKIEFTNEELARMCIANFILNLKPLQEVHLVTMYNQSHGTDLTSTQALYTPDVLRFCVATMNNISDKMENMSILFNSDGYDRFTPKSEQHFYILSDFMMILQTVVNYAAFNERDIMAHPDVLVPYWQASGTKGNMLSWASITALSGTNAEGKQCDVTNLIGVIFDREALGTFRDQPTVRTTPINARGLYYNTFWHERQFWFNDMSENGVAFYFD